MVRKGEKDVKFRIKNSGLSPWMETLPSSSRRFIILTPVPVEGFLVAEEPVISHPHPGVTIVTVLRMVSGHVIKGSEMVLLP